MVDCHRQQLSIDASTEHANTAKLVLPREPIVDTEEAGPTGRWQTIWADVACDSVVGLILAGGICTRQDWIWAGRVVDPENDDVRFAVAGQVGDCHAATLVVPGEPVGHIHPRRPAGRDIAVGV